MRSGRPSSFYGNPVLWRPSQSRCVCYFAYVYSVQEKRVVFIVQHPAEPDKGDKSKIERLRRFHHDDSFVSHSVCETRHEHQIQTKLRDESIRNSVLEHIAGLHKGYFRFHVWKHTSINREPIHPLTFTSSSWLWRCGIFGCFYFYLFPRKKEKKRER